MLCHAQAQATIPPPSSSHKKASQPEEEFVNNSTKFPELPKKVYSPYRYPILLSQSESIFAYSMQRLDVLSRQLTAAARGMDEFRPTELAKAISHDNWEMRQAIYQFLSQVYKPLFAPHASSLTSEP